MKVRNQAIYNAPFGYASEINDSFIQVHHDCDEVSRLVMDAYDCPWEFTYHDEEDLPLDFDPDLKWRLYDMRNRATKLMRSMQRNLKAAKKLHGESYEIICRVLDDYNLLSDLRDGAKREVAKNATEWKLADK